VTDSLVPSPILDTAASTAEKRKRKRIAPYIRVACQYHDGRWSFHESVRSLRGRTPVQVIVLSGYGNTELVEQLDKCMTHGGQAPTTVFRVEEPLLGCVILTASPFAP